MNYYEHHLGDYAAATGHLTWDEDMAYTRLLRAYYHHERGITEGQAYRLARASTPAQRRAVDAVLAEFFVLADGVYAQKRADAEIGRYQDKQRKAKASAEARWSQSGRNANASPDAMRTHAGQTAENASASRKVSKANDSGPSAIAGGGAPKSLKDKGSSDADAMRTHSEGNAPRHQTPDTSKEISKLSLAPALPPEDRPPDLLGDQPQTQPKGPPDCPHMAVLALWAEVLPHLPQHLPTQWRGARSDHLRARWRETAVEKGWTEDGQGLAYLRKLFGYIAQSEFLTGRGRQSDPTKRPFVIELEWLVNPANWAKVHEGKYHPEAA